MVKDELVKGYEKYFDICRELYEKCENDRSFAPKLRYAILGFGEDCEEWMVERRDEDLYQTFAADMEEQKAYLQQRAIEIAQKWQEEYAPHMETSGCIMEFTAGVGGEEAYIFAGELLNMYAAACQAKKWKTNVVTTGVTRKLYVYNSKAYDTLLYEGGVHRVQRVPVTETRGRIHTSTAKISVLPMFDDIQINLRDEDIDFTACRSGGKGGQNVNRVSTKVRLVHKPTGIAVECEEERSQLMNRNRAMQKLREILYQREFVKRQAELSKSKAAQVKMGERSDKIRTYNAPDDRITDHRIKKSWAGINNVLSGHVWDIINEVHDTLEEE